MGNYVRSQGIAAVDTIQRTSQGKISGEFCCVFGGEWMIAVGHGGDFAFQAMGYRGWSLIDTKCIL